MGLTDFSVAPMLSYHIKEVRTSLYILPSSNGCGTISQPSECQVVLGCAGGVSSSPFAFHSVVYSPYAHTLYHPCMECSTADCIASVMAPGESVRRSTIVQGCPTSHVAAAFRCIVRSGMEDAQHFVGKKNATGSFYVAFSMLRVHPWGIEDLLQPGSNLMMTSVLHGDPTTFCSKIAFATLESATDQALFIELLEELCVSRRGRDDAEREEEETTAMPFIGQVRLAVYMSASRPQSSVSGESILHAEQFFSFMPEMSRLCAAFGTRRESLCEVLVCRRSGSWLDHPLLSVLLPGLLVDRLHIVTCISARGKQVSRGAIDACCFGCSGSLSAHVSLTPSLSSSLSVDPDSLLRRSLVVPLQATEINGRLRSPGGGCSSCGSSVAEAMPLRCRSITSAQTTPARLPAAPMSIETSLRLLTGPESSAVRKASGDSANENCDFEGELQGSTSVSLSLKLHNRLDRSGEEPRESLNIATLRAKAAAARRIEAQANEVARRMEKKIHFLELSMDGDSIEHQQLTAVEREPLLVCASRSAADAIKDSMELYARYVGRKVQWLYQSAAASYYNSNFTTGTGPSTYGEFSARMGAVKEVSCQFGRSRFHSKQELWRRDAGPSKMAELVDNAPLRVFAAAAPSAVVGEESALHAVVDGMLEECMHEELGQGEGPQHLVLESGGFTECKEAACGEENRCLDNREQMSAVTGLVVRHGKIHEALGQVQQNLGIAAAAHDELLRGTTNEVIWRRQENSPQQLPLYSAAVDAIQQMQHIREQHYEERLLLMKWCDEQQRREVRQVLWLISAERDSRELISNCEEELWRSFTLQLQHWCISCCTCTDVPLKLDDRHTFSATPAEGSTSRESALGAPSMVHAESLATYCVARDATICGDTLLTGATPEDLAMLDVAQSLIKEKLEGLIEELLSAASELEDDEADMLSEVSRASLLLRRCDADMAARYGVIMETCIFRTGGVSRRTSLPLSSESPQHISLPE